MELRLSTLTRSTRAAEGARLGGRDHIAVHDVERIVALRHVQLRQRPPGAAHGVERAAVKALDRCSRGEVLPRDPVSPFRRVAARIEQSQSAERERHARAERRALEADQFQRTAAHVAPRSRRPCGTPPSPRGPRARLPAAPPMSSISLPRAPVAAARKSAPFRASRVAAVAKTWMVGDLHVAAEDLERPQGRQGALHPFRPEEPRRTDATAEAAQHFFIEDRRQRAGKRLVGDEAHGIRADIHDGDRTAGHAALHDRRRRPSTISDVQHRGASARSWDWIRARTCRVPTGWDSS